LEEEERSLRRGKGKRKGQKAPWEMERGRTVSPTGGNSKKNLIWQGVKKKTITSTREGVRGVQFESCGGEDRGRERRRSMESS